MSLARPLKQFFRATKTLPRTPPSCLTIKRHFAFATPETDDINFIPESVAFNAIDSFGRTRRFYRQVFINQITTNGPNFVTTLPTFPVSKESIFDEPSLNVSNNNKLLNENDGDIKSNTAWTIHLDNRILMTNGNPIILDSYKLALIMASELESQSEYMRLESMPICQTVISYLDDILGRGQFGSSLSMQRNAYKGSIVSNFENDLIKICENEKLYKNGYYKEYWQPVIDWFNKSFSSNIEMIEMFMKGEEAPISEYNKLGNDFSGLLDLNAASLMDNFKNTEISKKIDYLEEEAKNSNNDEMKAIRMKNIKQYEKFLSHLDTVRLWMIDDLVQYCYSSMLATALVCNAFSLDHILKCVHCPELRTQMYDENTESLKENETKLKLAAVRVFLDCFDDVVAFENPVIKRNDKPVM